MKKLIAYILCCLLLIGVLSLPINRVFGQGGVTNFSTVLVDNFYRALPRTAITVTANATINATGSYQRLTSAGVVGTSADNVTIKPAGSVLILVNTGASTITITETANIKSAGNIALGTLDTATLISDGADWYQIAGSNN